MTDRVIKYEDIRAGDTIRIEWESLDSLHTRTATVDRRGENGEWMTGRDVSIYARGKGCTIYLVNRPMQPLPTMLGSVILVTETSGKTSRLSYYAVLICDGLWFSIPSGLRHHPSRITGWKEAKLVAIEDETE